LPDNFKFIGSVLVAADAEYMLPKWWSKINKDLPVILLNQGTIAKNHNDLITPTIEALKDEPVTVIIVPVTEGELNNLPNNMYVESYIPFGNLLPHIDIMISNGGLGATQNALAHGIPLIIAGATEDKMEVAARVENSGAGINLRTQSPLPSDIKNAVNNILVNPAFKQKARELQADYANYDAVKLAVESIEKLIGETKI
jgi:MGT family glycosyltransferase